MVLVIGRVGRPERGVIKNPNLPSYVLHVNFHLLHGAVEDTFSLFHRKGDFFRHEAAIVDWNPGSVVLSKRNQHQPARLCPSELSLARMETLSVWPRPKGADCYRAHRTSCLVLAGSKVTFWTDFKFILSCSQILMTTFAICVNLWFPPL